MVIKGVRVFPLLKKTVREIGADRVPTLAASAAYNFFFSLFPLLLFLAPLLSLVDNKEQVIGFIMGQLLSVLPVEDAPAIQEILKKVVFSSSAPGLMSVGLLLAAWSGSNIFGTLMGALNTAYDVQETRSWIKQQVIRLGTFVLGGFIVALSTIVFLNGEGVASWLGRLLHLGRWVIVVWQIIQVPIAMVGLIGLAFTTLYFLPNVKQRKRHVLLVATLTTFLWIAATLVFRIYVDHFPPNPAYGLIGGIIILLTWMYYTMFVVLIGGELASELHLGTAAVAPEQGAVYLGRIVTSSGPGTESMQRRA
jgi:membrane protein